MIEFLLFALVSTIIIFALALLPRIDKPYYGFRSPKVEIDIENLKIDKNGFTIKK